MANLSAVPLAAWILAVLALVFGALALGAYRRRGTAPSPARKAWIRIALIFGAVSIVLISLACAVAREERVTKSYFGAVTTA